MSMTKSMTNHILKETAIRYFELDKNVELMKNTISDHKKAVDTMKKIMKEANIQKYSFRRGNVVYKIEFKISRINRLDTKKIPESVRQQYLTTSEIWKIKSSRIADDEISDEE